jgi:hypothetical protein
MRVMGSPEVLKFLTEEIAEIYRWPFSTLRRIRFRPLAT